MPIQSSFCFVFISIIVPMCRGLTTMLGIETAKVGQRGKPEVRGRGVRRCWSGGEGRMRRGW